MAAVAEYHIPVSKVDLLHAGDCAIADFTQNLKDHIEDKLQLESQVNVKRRYKKEDNVAEEVVQAVLKLENAEEERRAVIIISQRLCEVMKNNQERCEAFQNKILEDLEKPRDKRRFALLCFNGVAASGDHYFREAFSQEFVDNFVQGPLGILMQDGSPLNDRMSQIVNEIQRQWFGEPNHREEMDPSGTDVGDINTVRIVHGGAKMAVREIGKELENGFMLEDSSRYKLYNRVAESQIPEVVLCEIREFLTSDGPHGLCVIVWCEKFIRLFGASQLGQFQELVTRSDPSRLVHVCFGVSEYEVKRHYSRLTGMAFLQLDMDDGGVVVENLTPRILHALSQARRTPMRQDQGSMDDMPSTPEGNQEPRPPSSADRQLSEVSQPEALASGLYEGQSRPRVPDQGQRPRFLDQQAPRILDQQHTRLLMQQPPSLAAQPHPPQVLQLQLPTGAISGLVGNPSNQNPQGGRVVLPAGNSYSMSSAGYGSDGNVAGPGRPGQGNNNGIVQQAQPTADSNPGGQDWKIVPNSGDSYNDVPLEHDIANECQKAMMENGIGKQANWSYSPPGSSGNNNHVQRGSLDGANSSSSDGTSQPYLQASSSGSSTNKDRYLADGEHSMPITSISSGNFGSQEPVLPSRVMTVEPSMNPRGSPVSMTAYLMSPGSSQSQFSGAPSLQPPTNKWAPSDFPSTEMQASGSSFPNEPVRREANFPRSSNMDGNLRSLEEDHRPSASKFPRRGDAGGISPGSEQLVLRRGYASESSISLVNNLSQVRPHDQQPHSSLSINGVSGGPSSLPYYSSSSNNVTGSQPSSLPGQPQSFPGQPQSLPGQSQSFPGPRPSLPRQSSNNFNVSGLVSALAGGAEDAAAPIVQCTADGDGVYPSNLPSQDAFRQQDYRDIGPGQQLPNRPIGAQFMSVPAGQRCGEETNEGERAGATPGGLGQTAREVAAPTKPADQPIKEMDYRCLQKLTLQLDPDSTSGNNWKVFAHHYKMKPDMVRFIASKNSVNYTEKLLEWLTENKPNVTCGDFKQVARQHQRYDVVKMMEKFHY